MHLTGWATEESAYFRAAQSRLLSVRRGDLRLAVVGCSGGDDSKGELVGLGIEMLLGILLEAASVGARRSD